MMSGGGCGRGRIGSESSNVLQRKQDRETALAQLLEEIEQLEIMSARTCLDLLNLATMGDAVRMNSEEEVNVTRLRSLGVEIEKAKASMRELRREILEAKRERTEVLDGLYGFMESHPAVYKQEGSPPRAKRSINFKGMIFGIATLGIALSVLKSLREGR